MAKVLGRLAVGTRINKASRNIATRSNDELASPLLSKTNRAAKWSFLLKGPAKKQPYDEKLLKDMLVEELLKSSLRDAVKTVTELSGQPRRKVYQLAIELDA